MMGFMCYYGHVQNTSNLGEGNNLFKSILKSLSTIYNHKQTNIFITYARNCSIARVF